MDLLLLARPIHYAAVDEAAEIALTTYVDAYDLRRQLEGDFLNLSIAPGGS
jgi:hypothetical protein